MAAAIMPAARCGATAKAECCERPAEEQVEVLTAAEQPEVYLPLLKGKRVALLSNHTGILPSEGGKHLLDVLIDSSVTVTTILSPEHGFRGTADAGEKVNNSVDAATGVPIVSLYGGKKSENLNKAVAGADIVVSDMQDVGVRFYTYYITMIEAMEEAARQGKEFMILDRPNPLGMKVDGPVLDKSLFSGVGRLQIPVIHGMTLGELARMAVGERWLNTDKELQLTVIPCKGYTHSTRYQLPVAPSPNLLSMQAILLYPSICLFEGTILSLGRGTDTPFCVYGHPDMTDCDYSFTPRPCPGAKNPPLNGQVCHGRQLNDVQPERIINRGLDLSYVIDAYSNKGMKRAPKFFTPFFDKLIGNSRVRKMIEAGHTADEIAATWRDEVEQFIKQREPYLLYPL